MYKSTISRICIAALCVHYFSESTQLDNLFRVSSFIADPHTYDPRKRLKELDRAYHHVLAQPYYEICKKDKNALLDHNRNTYEAYCSIQRKLALKNIKEKCGLKLQRAIASFMIGELQEHPEKLILSRISIDYQRMLSRPISCIPEPWHACEFATTKKHAFFIPESRDDSRLLHFVDLDVDICIAMCHIPTTVGNIINVDGSIEGLCILFGSQKHLLWNGTDTLLFNHKFPHEPHYLPPAMLRKLPTYTVSLRRDKGPAQGALVAQFINKRGNKIKHVIATQQEMNVCNKIVMGQHRQKCLIICDTWVKTFHAPTNNICLTRCGGTVNGSMPDEGNDILLHDDFNGLFLRSPDSLFNLTNNTKAAYQKLTDGCVNETGTIIAYRFLTSPDTSIVQIASHNEFPKATLQIAGINGSTKHIRLKGDRLLIGTEQRIALGSRATTYANSMIDIDEVVELITTFTPEQADICESLLGARKVYVHYVLGTKKNVRPSDFPKKIVLNADQTKVWKSIPLQLRTRLIGATSDILQICCSKKRSGNETES